MAITSAQISATFTAAQAGSNAFSAGPYWGASMAAALTFGNGTTANNADIVLETERTVTTGATDTVDLNGVIADALGTTIAGVKLVAVFIINQARDGTANTTNLTVGGASQTVPLITGGTTPSLAAIRPGGIFLMCNPDVTGICAMTAGSSDILAVTNSAGATAKYQIGILARSA